MVEAKRGDTVKVHYTGKLDNGRVFDSSIKKEPFQFTLGEGKIIPGFEKAVIGMKAGESKTITIPPEEAYGPHRDDLVATLERSELPSYLDPKVGQMLEIRRPGGGVLRVIITAVDEMTVTLDGNHPLAGKVLTFEIELIEIA
ncbi:MAG TPA: peptidylprolyl isomerase [bacterium (Candidatus Stahlbacteria)]|nr:peptidylprolyl isomerase [Candidatus Stahlbacteria bacterium]